MKRVLSSVGLALLTSLALSSFGCSEASSEGEAASGAGGNGASSTDATSSSGDPSSTSASTASAGGGSATSSSGSGGSGTGGAGAGTSEDGWPGRVFAPFVDATAYPTPKLGEIAQNEGVLHYALGFLVAQDASTCEASWGTYYDVETGPSAWDGGAEYFLYDHIAAVRALGGDVLVSFGGAAGTELAGACADVDSLVAAYSKVIDKLDLTRVDFDIEGFWVADTASIQRRSAAMAKLKANYAAQGKPLTLWLTLPVLPTGLTSEGIAVVNSALDAGIELGGVNIMTMDYGDAAAPNPDGQMGAYGIGAATALKDQLAAAYQAHGINKTEAELWAQVGITPMIGMNDVTTEIFHLSDAAETVDFAKQNGLGWLGMWSLNRDHACPGQNYVGVDCSSTPDQSVDYEFSSVFLGFGP